MLMGDIAVSGGNAIQFASGGLDSIKIERNTGANGLEFFTDSTQECLLLMEVMLVLELIIQLFVFKG